MRSLLIGLIQSLPVVRQPAARAELPFLPDLFRYAHEAIRRHGPLRGSWFAARRIGRCHPWNPGGYDPVPDSSDALTATTNKRPSHG